MLSHADVWNRLATVHGANLVRNAFPESWPCTPALLGPLNVAFVRDLDLADDVRLVTGASPHLVTRRLNAAHGRKLIRNLFWDWWPDEYETVASGESERALAEPAPVRIPEPDSEEQPDVRPGTLLSGRYTLRRELGKGGFGTSWEAHDALSDMDVVLKIPHTDDGGAIKNELRQAFRIVHPNICQAFPERDDDTGQPFLVMQHGGEDLATRLQRGQPMPLALAVYVLVSIADALDFLHERLVLHLDVTPGNILIDDEDAVHLTDFGASANARTHFSAGGHQTKLATELHYFNMAYAAPELYDGIARSRSDQYSLFLVFCSLLHGHVHNKPYYDFEDLSVLSDAQNAIVRRALSKKPEQRFDTCGEPARALADELARVPEQVLAEDVARIASDFVRRVRTEQQRISSGTARLGGAVKLGRGLERFLQAVLRLLASSGGFQPLDAVRSVDSHATSLDRVTAGALATCLAGRGPAGQVSVPEVLRLLADLERGRESRTWHLINARNDVVHGRRPAEAILPHAVALADVLSG